MRQISKDGLLPGTCPVCPRNIGDLNKNKLGEYVYYGRSKKHSLGVAGQYLYQKELRERK